MEVDRLGSGVRFRVSFQIFALTSRGKYPTFCEWVGGGRAAVGVCTRTEEQEPSTWLISQSFHEYVARRLARSGRCVGKCIDRAWVWGWAMWPRIS